jgi:hypothetical protein
MLPAIAITGTEPAVLGLGALLGPLAVLATAAVLVTLGVLLVALVLERRDRDDFGRLADRGPSVTRLDAPKRSPRIAA